MPQRAEVRRITVRRKPGRGGAARPTEHPLAAPAAAGAPRRASGRALAFALLCGLCLLVGVGYAALAIARTRPAATSAPGAAAPRPAASGQGELLYVRTDGGL